MVDTEELIERIERAFDAVPHPGDAHLTDSEYGDEPEALERTFAGERDWRQLDAAFLDRASSRCGGLAFFSDPAFRYYLPAYLIADLRGLLTEVEPTVRLCASVTPQSEDVRVAERWGGGTLGERARASFGQLSPEQRACIVDYLWWKLENDALVDPLTVEDALEHYWLRDP